MGKENLETHSVGASPVPAAPYKAELSMKVGVQPLPQGCHRLTKRQSGGGHPSFPPQQATERTNSSCLLGARVPHSLSPMAHNCPGTLGSFLQNPRQLTHTLSAPMRNSEIL